MTSSIAIKADPHNPLFQNALMRMSLVALCDNGLKVKHIDDHPLLERDDQVSVLMTLFTDLSIHRLRFYFGETKDWRTSLEKLFGSWGNVMDLYAYFGVLHKTPPCIITRMQSHDAFHAFDQKLSKYHAACNSEQLRLTTPRSQQQLTAPSFMELVKLCENGLKIPQTRDNIPVLNRDDQVSILNDLFEQVHPETLLASSDKFRSPDYVSSEDMWTDFLTSVFHNWTNVMLVWDECGLLHKTPEWIISRIRSLYSSSDHVITDPGVKKQLCEYDSKRALMCLQSEQQYQELYEDPVDSKQVDARISIQETTTSERNVVFETAWAETKDAVAAENALEESESTQQTETGADVDQFISEMLHQDSQGSKCAEVRESFHSNSNAIARVNRRLEAIAFGKISCNTHA